MTQENPELILLSLNYERYVSRAHTVFSAFWDIFFGVIVGGIGLVLAFIQAKVIEIHNFTILAIIIIFLGIIGIVSLTSFYIWYESRVQRKKIEEKIKSICNAQSNRLHPPINPDR